MTTNRDRALTLLNDLAERMDDDAVSTLEAVEELHDAGLLMPDIPDGLNLIGFERKGGGGGLIWDDRITTEALTKGYAAMFSRLDSKEI